MVEVVDGIPAASEDDRAPTAAPVLCPFDIRVERIAAFLNAELPEHPVYDGFELQWFDDVTHGVGLLVFLSRRDDRRVDYYVASGLEVDRAAYVLGGGTGVWVETDFDRARLEVDAHGALADVRFTDVDGRLVEVRVDDRRAGTGRRGVLLAPFGDGIERPTSLPLVYVHGFDLLRVVPPAPVVRIDGEDVAVGRLPGRVLHRRHLIKYGAPLTVTTVCRDGDGPVATAGSGACDVELDDDGRRIVAVVDRGEGGAAELVFTPPVPDLATLPVGHLRTGTWQVAIDDVHITGGTYHALRRPGDRVEVGLDVTERWQPPAGLPPLMRVVTRVIPTFRRWPTTYRWRAAIELGDAPTRTAGWERTTPSRGDAYRRATQR